MLVTCLVLCCVVVVILRITYHVSLNQQNYVHNHYEWLHCILPNTISMTKSTLFFLGSAQRFGNHIVICTIANCWTIWRITSEVLEQLMTCLHIHELDSCSGCDDDAPVPLGIICGKGVSTLQQISIITKMPGKCRGNEIRSKTKICKNETGNTGVHVPVLLHAFHVPYCFLVMVMMVYFWLILKVIG